MNEWDEDEYPTPKMGKEWRSVLTIIVIWILFVTISAKLFLR